MVRLQTAQKLDAAAVAKLEEAWRRVAVRPEAGFATIVDDEAAWTACAARARALRSAQRTLLLGIGGSSLGVQAVVRCCRGHGQIYFLEAPDPRTWSELGDLSAPDWRDKNVVIVSKSGTTLETLAWVEQLRAADREWLKTSQVTVIASPGNGPLQKFAAREKLECLWIPANVGGRFSVLTAAGMFPAALLGLDLAAFRGGARWALANAKLAAQLSALILAAWERDEWVTQMWTYAEGLAKFGEWWQQLWGESLAKKVTRAGAAAPRASTPMACLGPRDQHSLVQQLIEGARDKFVFVQRVRELENAGPAFTPEIFGEMPYAGGGLSLGAVIGAEAAAFEKSLIDEKIPFASLEIEAMNEKSLGALFMLWQMCIAQLGEAMGIDPFNQPGVELGKRHAAAILSN